MTDTWSMGTAKAERVIVVGAGMAGLVAAPLILPRLYGAGLDMKLIAPAAVAGLVGHCAGCAYPGQHLGRSCLLGPFRDMRDAGFGP